MLTKAFEMNNQIPDMQVDVKWGKHKYISPYKWIVMFVGSERYECEIVLKELFQADRSNINLIIVGIDI